LELHQVDQDVRWLSIAIKIAQAMIDRFWDDDGGGFFQTAEGTVDIIHRHKDAYDGAVPSGNSVALHALLWLHRITGEPLYLEKADALIAAFSGAILRSPDNYAHFLSGLDLRLGTAFVVVIAGEEGESITSFLKALAPTYAPNGILLVVGPGEEGDLLRHIAPVTREHHPQNGRAMAWACTETECLPGTADPTALLDMIRSLK
jgi:uncharacterized protein YyaL (SSP411 family)